MTKEELLERYEALDDEEDFLAAKLLYEQALAEHEDARLRRDYGYLLASHSRRELRRAVDEYERGIELAPDDDTLHYQLILGRASLLETGRAVDLYEQRLAAAPGSLREHRFLAAAYLYDGAYGKAGKVIAAGLELAPDDAALVERRGELKAATGDPEGALADWRRVLELVGHERISALYSTAFLLEREGRREEAATTWEAIIAWNEERGYDLQTVWPREMLELVRR